MKKSEKIKNSVKCFNLIEELGIKVKINGNWLVLPPDVPLELILLFQECDMESLVLLIEGVNNVENNRNTMS